MTGQELKDLLVARLGKMVELFDQSADTAKSSEEHAQHYRGRANAFASLLRMIEKIDASGPAPAPENPPGNP
jgi:hypothetical protein